jgi:P pilus assembly chaperone PapD
MLGINLRKLIQASALFLFSLHAAYAEGGISLSSTRLIYNDDKKQVSMSIKNTHPNKRYLMNSWVEDEDGQKTERIIVTPPLFVSEADSENTLRVVRATEDLAKDRETLFYLNIQAVPSLKRLDLAAEQSVLQVTVLSRVKMMLRPKGLKIQPSEVTQLIKANNTSQGIRIENPTPYFVTLIEMKVDGKNQESVMIKPYSEHFLQVSGRQLIFQNIDDYGVTSEPIVLNII